MADRSPRKRRGAQALQACDRCRIKKVKCIPFRSTCEACADAGTACTFDAPLSSSRSKRVRRGLGMPPGTRAGERDTALHTVGMEVGAREGWPVLVHTAAAPRRGSRSGDVTAAKHREGPTAISYILHAMPSLPLRAVSALEGYSMRSGYMSVTTPRAHADTDVEGVGEGWVDATARLVDSYLADAVLPLVTREDIETDETGLLRRAVAAVAASRGVPPVVFDALRTMVFRDLVEYDVMAVPTTNNVQVLLVLCLVDELAHTPNAASPPQVIRARLGAALRLARDLRLGGRIWSCLRILDVWHAAKTGTAPLVEPEGDRRTIDGPSAETDDFLAHCTRLSVIVGRMLAREYGPTGLEHTSNADVLELRDALDRWKANLPAVLVAQDRWAPRTAGLLHVLYTAARFLLYRPVMRWSFIVPARLELNCDVPAWLDLLALSRLAVDVVAAHDAPSSIEVYALTLACLVQYHTWARRGEWDGAVVLDRARAAARRWCDIPDGHMPLLRRDLAVIDLLYDVTQSPRENLFDGPRGLDPTPGVINRLAETLVAGVTFLRDASLPGGGVLVATQKAAREVADLPPGTIVLGSTGPGIVDPDT